MTLCLGSGLRLDHTAQRSTCRFLPTCGEHKSCLSHRLQPASRALPIAVLHAKMITRKFVELALALLVLAGQSNAHIPSTWKPQDIISYFCSRWYHQCEKICLLLLHQVLTLTAVIKNDILYLYGGAQTVCDDMIDSETHMC